MNKDILEITDIKDMLKKTKDIIGDRPAYKIRVGEGEYKTITHSEIRDMVDCLGTALIDMGLKGKRIAVIGENRYEWCLGYLSVLCGTGIIVPLDKMLPANELESLIERSEVEAIFYSEKYEEILQKIKLSEKNKLKHLISMDLDIHKKGIYSQKELVEKGKKLIKNGNREFIDAKIDPEAMNVMLFTSGTTSKPKVVALCHRNLATNLMDITRVLDVNSTDRVLSFLPLHHVFECMAGMFYSLYVGSQMSFCDGIRYILQNLNEYKITFTSFVPAIYENMYKNITKKLMADGKLEMVNLAVEKYKDAPMEVKKEVFKEIHAIFGGEVRLFVSGAAALDPEVEQSFRNWGFNLCQGYGLKAKLVDVNDEGMGELAVKGPNVMLGYYDNEEATKEVIQDGWFLTGDLAKIDEDGYIFLCGRKKSVIVLKNGKNIFPEEMETIVNKIEGVKESFIFGKVQSEDKDDIKINVKIVYDRAVMKTAYKVETDEEIRKVISDKIKEINRTMPLYKAIRGILLTEEPLIKTTTNKLKREENLKMIENN